MLENILFDQQLFLMINQISDPLLNFLFTYISILGSTVFSFLVAAVIWLKKPKLGTLLVIVLIVNLAFLYGAKTVIDRPRPSLELTDVKILELEKDSSTSSFPSGHTDKAFVLATVIGNFYPASRIVLFIVAIAVGFSRIYVGSHFPLDVLAGAITGIILSLLIIKYQSKFNKLFEISDSIHKKIFGKK